MKEKINKIIDKIALVVLCIVILLLNIYIGSNISDPRTFIYLLVTIFTGIYVIVKKIVSKEKILIKNKVDICMILLLLSTAIPLIVNKYVSLGGTYDFIMKYLTVYGIYVLARNVLVTEKRINIITSSVIIFSIIPIIFGLDKLNGNFFADFLEKLNSTNVDSNRFVSTFGYPNAVAAYLSLTMFLSISKFINNKNKFLKVLNVLYILLAIVCIVLTQSKTVLVLLALIGAIFFIKAIKDKKIGKKTFIAIGILIVLFITYVIVAMQIPEVVEVTRETKTITLEGFEPSTKYNFEFVIDAKSDKEKDMFEIELVEVGRYLEESIIKRISFSTYTGIKNIEFETSDNASYLKLNIKNKVQEHLVIEKLYVNSEEYILNHKYISKGLVRIFSNFSLKYQSVWQRGDFIQDGIKLIKENWLFGGGGNTWLYQYNQVQDYLYYAKEAHSYPIEVWMSFGLLGIISLLAIVIITASNAIKILKGKEKKSYFITMLSIILGVGLILVHSIVDFDMSFLIVLITVYMFIGIINKEDEEVKIPKLVSNIIDTILIIVFLVAIYFNSKQFYCESLVKDESYRTQTEISEFVTSNRYNKIKYLVKQKEQNGMEGNSTKELSYELIEEIKKALEVEPYVSQIDMYDQFYYSILDVIDDNNYKEQLENAEYLYNIMINTRASIKYKVEDRQERQAIFMSLANGISKYSEDLSKKMYKQIIEEYPEGIDIITQYKKTKQVKGIAQLKIESYMNMYQLALKKIEQ